jgi:hypothetical protein
MSDEENKKVVYDNLTRLLDLADEYGVVLCHENENKIYGESPARCLELMEHFGGRLKCVFDMGNFVLDGHEPYPYGYELLKEHIAYFHIKDSFAEGAIVPAGCGNAHIEEILNAQRDVTYYMLSHLPEDLVPYWDYTFTDGSDEPRDTSAAAIAVCGMLDMAQRLPEGSEQRLIYESAAAQIMEVLIDHYTGDIGVEYGGLINTVTHAKPQGHAIEECAPYADYFYLEALARYLKEDFIRPW